jgi:hypothetical protein
MSRQGSPVAAMAASKTRKDRQRERRQKRSESASRLFQRALGGFAGDEESEESSGAPATPDPPPPAPAAPDTPPPMPSNDVTEETEVGVSAFFSLEERAYQPGSARESFSEGSEGGEASIEYEPLISDSDEQARSDSDEQARSDSDEQARSDSTEDQDAAATTASAITEDISTPGPRDRDDSTLRSGLNALDDYGVDMALVAEVTPQPSAETDVGLQSPDRETVADGPVDLPAGWGPVEGEAAPGAEEVALAPALQDPFQPAAGEVDVSLPPWDDVAESASEDLAGEGVAAEDDAGGDEPSCTEDSADMMYIVLEDTRDFPDLDPAHMPTPPDEPLETPPAPEVGETTGGDASAVKDGMRELRAGRRDEAIALFERALRIDPDDAMAAAYLNLALELMIRDTLPDASLTSVPRLRVGREMLLTLDVSAELGAVLALVDGVSDLDALETLLPHLQRTTLYRLLAEALEQGLIEL